MKTSITIISPAMEVHKAGCADIARTLRNGYTKTFGQAEDSTTYSGETLDEAILAANKDLAAWFGEEYGTPEAEAAGCWTVAACHQAPCFRSLR